VYRRLVQPLTRDYRDFLDLLAKHRVRYLVAGGYALAAHGVPRYTKDLDLWVEPTPDNARKLVAVLDDFGFASLGLQERDFTEADTVIQLGYEPNRIDLLTGVSGLEFAAAHAAHVAGRFGNLEVPILDRRSLILNKRTVGRPQDLVDVSQLEQLPEEEP
jgi:hypothetical protein